MQFFNAIAMAMAMIALVGAQDNTKCNGGESEGQEVVSGAYYYTCTGGQLVPAGCLSDTQQRIPIGQTFNAASTQKTCVLEGTSLTTKCTACIGEDGKLIARGETATIGSSYLQCVDNGDSLDLQVQGCVSDGKNVAIGETTTVNDQQLICQRTSNKVATLNAAGCVNGGKTYEIGTEFQTETAVYHCALVGTTTLAKPIGCVFNGKKIYDLDLFQDGDVFWRCRVGETTVSKELFGCALKEENGSVTPKSVACTWEVLVAGLTKVVKCCIKDKTGLETAHITDLYCLYTYNGGDIQIDEGCWRQFGATNAGCQRQTDGSLQVKVYDPKDMSPAVSDGLHQCL